MWIPYRRRWTLWRTERRLRRSAPHLAAMLAIFARLTAGEAIASREQAGRADRIRRAAAWLRRGLAAAAAWLSGCGRRVRRRLRCAAALRWRLGASARNSADLPPIRENPGDPR